MNENENGDPNALPDASRTPVVIVTVIEADGSSASGVNVAVRVAGLYTTDPPRSAPPEVFTTNVDALIVVAAIASLKVTVIVDDRGTDEPDGVDADTCGAVTSGGVTADDAVSAESAETFPSFPFAETAYLYAVPPVSPLST